MPGKHIFLSIFLFVILFQITLCKNEATEPPKNKKISVECYVDKDIGKFCKFSPKNRDGPDLSTCKKKKCDYGCGRSYQMGGVQGISSMSAGSTITDWSRVKRIANPMDGLAEINLGCVTAWAKDKDCKTLKPGEGGGVCVCQKKLCNSATNIAPATFIFLLLWIIGLTR